MSNRLNYQLHSTFTQKVSNFPSEIYPLSPNQHLTKLLHTLIEDPGVGQLKKIQTLARLAESLGGTQFSDLDFFYGSFLRFNRLAEEVYTYDPFRDQLTSDQWKEVKTKDASYRGRIALF